MEDLHRVRGGLRRRVARGVFASGAVQVAARVLSLGLAVVIARVLEPGEVGLLGLASIVVTVLSVVGSCADTGGVVGRGEGSDAGYAAAAVVVRAGFTALLVGVVLVSLPALSHVLAGREGAESELSTLVHLLLWQLALEVVAGFPRVMLLRRLRFIWVAAADVMLVVGHVGLALVLLWNGYRAVGVVMASLLGGVLGGGVLWLGLGRDWRTVTGASIDAHVCRETLIGAAKVVAARSTGYVNCRVDNLIVASVLGPTAMSYYGMAWTASRQAMGLLDEALGSVLTPALAQIHEDRERVALALREAVRHYYLLLIPASVGLFVAAPELVTLVLGAKWLPLVPCLRVMCITVLGCPLMTGCSSLLTASGRAHLFGVAAGAQFVALVIILPVLSWNWGILGAALGDLVGVIVLAVGLRMAAARVIPGMRWDALRAGGTPFVAGLGAGAAGWMLGSQVGDAALRLLCEILMVGFGYVSILWCFGGRDSIRGFVAALQEVARPSASAAGARSPGASVV